MQVQTTRPAVKPAARRNPSCRWHQRPQDGVGILHIDTGTAGAYYEVVELRSPENLASFTPWPEAFRLTKLAQVEGEPEPVYDLVWSCTASRHPLVCGCPDSRYANRQAGCKHARAVLAAYKFLDAEANMADLKFMAAEIEALCVDEPGFDDATEPAPF